MTWKEILQACAEKGELPTVRITSNPTAVGKITTVTDARGNRKVGVQFPSISYERFFYENTTTATIGISDLSLVNE